MKGISGTRHCIGTLERDSEIPWKNEVIGGLEALAKPRKAGSRGQGWMMADTLLAT